MRYQRHARLNAQWQCIVPVLISPPLGQRPDQRPYLALVDTGANTTAVTNRVREACSLPAIGQAEHSVSTASGMTRSHEYGVHVSLELASVEPPSQPTQFGQLLQVLIASPAPGYDVLLGMDFLQRILIVAWESTMTIAVDIG